MGWRTEYGEVNKNGNGNEKKKEKYGEKGIKVSGKKKDGGTRNMRNGNEKNEKDCSKLGLKNCFDLQVKLGSRSK